MSTVKEVITAYQNLSLTDRLAFYSTLESYTSGTSWLDGEAPDKKRYNNQRRVHRGLFRSNAGLLINADVNAAYQIMKKAGYGENTLRQLESVHRIKVA